MKMCVLKDYKKNHKSYYRAEIKKVNHGLKAKE